MPPFAAAVLAAIAGNIGSDLARDRLAMIRDLFARVRIPGEPRVRTRTAPQLPARPVLLTPPVGAAPWPLPRRTATDLAARLEAARR